MANDNWDDWNDINDPGNKFKSRKQEEEEAAEQRRQEKLERDNDKEPVVEKPKEKPPAEVSFYDGEFAPHPVYGYAPNKECVVKGKAKFLKATPLARLTLKLYAIYEGVEEDLVIKVEKYGTTEINTQDGTFLFSAVPLYYHSKYPYEGNDKAFITPIRFKAVISHVNHEKPLEIFLDFPSKDDIAPLTLKRGMFDDKACELFPDKYTKGAEGYVEGTPIYQLQTMLEEYRYLAPRTANGTFGPKTEEAVKAFQKDSLSTPRVSKRTSKLVDAVSVSYKGQVSGEVEATTRDELQKWKIEEFRRPLPEIYHDDHDKIAVSSRIKPSSGDGFHPLYTPVQDLQKLLTDIKAYVGKQDGWVGDLTHAAISLFQEHAETGEFVDAEGKPVTLPEADRLKVGKKGPACVQTQAMAKKAKEKGWFVPPANITDSVGAGGKNAPEDVKKVKAKLKEHGYPVKDESETLTPDDIKAIKFFQAQITEIPAKNGTLVMPDGLMSKGKNTEKKLFATNAPKYSPPTKENERAIVSGIQKKIDAANDDIAEKWKKIKRVWSKLSPYLPSDSKLSSGYRSDAEQRAIVWDMYNVKYKDEITAKYSKAEWQKCKDMQAVDDTVADSIMCKQIKAAAGQDVAVPGKSNHRLGKAIDVGGNSDVAQVRSLLWCSVEFSAENLVEKIIKERNGCVHFEFD